MVICLVARNYISSCLQIVLLGRGIGLLNVNSTWL
jgi:hypothetical protein